jgi:hypothetical protein
MYLKNKGKKYHGYNESALCIEMSAFTMSSTIQYVWSILENRTCFLCEAIFFFFFAHHVLSGFIHGLIAKTSFSYYYYNEYVVISMKNINF